jgi:hypothetical protein
LDAIRVLEELNDSQLKQVSIDKLKKLLSYLTGEEKDYSRFHRDTLRMFRRVPGEARDGSIFRVTIRDIENLNDFALSNRIK